MTSTAITRTVPRVGDKVLDPQSPWFMAEYVSVYTRAQAIEDGDLVDVSSVASEAGFRYPVALTRAVWNLIETILESRQGWQDVKGRLWDVLWMGRLAAPSGRYADNLPPDPGAG